MPGSGGDVLFLHGAKKNAGDFLIRARGERILGHLLPDRRVVVVPRWMPLDPEVAGSASTIVLGGGPGLASDFYPGVFPLVANLPAIARKVRPVAVGWSGRPFSGLDDFEFSDESREALALIHAEIPWSAVRDVLSAQLVRSGGIDNVRVSGCFAWYVPELLGTATHEPDRVRRVVISPPSLNTHVREGIRLMLALRRRLRGADVACAFHRGLRVDALTSASQARAQRAMAVAARALGFRVIDAAYGTSGLELYGEADLHVGYRVHAHLLMASLRRPSVLICEDGRGVGQLQTMQSSVVPMAGTERVVAEVMSALDDELRTFEQLRRAVDVIEGTWPVMRETVLSL